MVAKPLSVVFQHRGGAQALLHLALARNVADVRFEQAIEPVRTTDTAYERHAQRRVIVSGVLANLRLNMLDGQFKRAGHPVCALPPGARGGLSEQPSIHHTAGDHLKLG